MASTELNLQDLRERLASHGVEDVRRLAGGASSLTYLASLGDGGQVVVKVAPPGVAPVHHRDVLRQARLMRALSATPVRAPEILWEDVGDPPDIPPLYAMSFLEGTSLEPLFDLDGHDDGEIVAARMRDAARALAALHTVVPAHVGLASEPVIGPADEVERWSRLLETVDASLAPGWEDVAKALHASEPPALPPAIVHGDFRLGNLLARGAQVTGVIDWEIWNVGDPRVDLGWFLANADPATYRRPTRYVSALPSPDELAAIYAGALGREVPAVGWFRALACFKSSATWSLIVKHNRRRSSPEPGLEAMAPVLPHLLERARELLD
ncbi:MAG: phosphotransferase family protein [Acidimicrobiales bacterium]